ncbi:hypothetical protein AXW83_21255 [Bosea sp. PAMC 26642]|nr:hypothetical protein AXW83_21255 [Bosea sp. PAMC 26642]
MAAAEEVGRLVAERGGVIVTGGRFGVMEAASRGAKAADGLTVGFLPAMDPKTANAYVDLVFPTGLGRARNLLTARSCDALIMIGGSCGTLNELTIAYAEARPVVILKGSGGWADRIIPCLQDGKYLDERQTVEISIAETPSAAVEMAFALATDASREAIPDRP